MVVQDEGAAPIVVGSYRELPLAVEGDRVDAGARGSLEAGVCPRRRSRKQVYELFET